MRFHRTPEQLKGEGGERIVEQTAEAIVKETVPRSLGPRPGDLAAKKQDPVSPYWGEVTPHCFIKVLRHIEEMEHTTGSQ